jgi:hypothetical protein
MIVTFFDDYAAATKREEQLSGIDLANKILATSSNAKAKLPWLKCARFGDIRTDANSLRHNSNVVAITGLEGDYDGKVMSIEAADKRLTDAGIEAIVYTSPSHTDAEPKWRILCFFSHEYPPAERDRFMARLNGLFGGIFDPASWTLSQAYYFGAVGKNPDHNVYLIDGICIDEADHLDATAIGKPEKPNGAGGEHHPASRPEDITDARIAGYIASLLANVSNAPDGAKHNTLFNIGRTLGGHLHEIGWSQQQAVEALLRALPPSVKDWKLAHRTASEAVALGMQQPLELENRPSPKGGRGNGSPPPPPPEPEPGPEPTPPEPPPQPDDDVGVAPPAAPPPSSSGPASVTLPRKPGSPRCTLPVCRSTAVTRTWCASSASNSSSPTAMTYSCRPWCRSPCRC